MTSPIRTDFDITPPITPLKTRKKSNLTPINIAAATAHFQETRSRSTSLSPPKPRLGGRNAAAADLMADALDTPPLSSTSTTGELSASFDAVHPLFGRLSVQDWEQRPGDRSYRDPHIASEGGRWVGTGLEPLPYWPVANPTLALPSPKGSWQYHADNDDSPSRAPPPTPLLGSEAHITPHLAMSQDMFHYASKTDSLVFFAPSQHTIVSAARTPVSKRMPPSTPKAKGRRHGKKRSRGHSAGTGRSPRRQRTPLGRTIGVSTERSSGAGPFVSEATSSSRHIHPSLDRHCDVPAWGHRANEERDVFMDDADDKQDSTENHSAFFGLEAVDTSREATRIPSPIKPFGTSLGNTPNARFCTSSGTVDLVSSSRSSRSPPQSLACRCGRRFSRHDAMQRHLRMSVCRGVGLGLRLGY